MRLRQVDIPHTLSRARPGREGLGRRRLGLFLTPQRGRIDDPLDDVGERLCDAHRRLGGRFDEQAPRLLGERRTLYRRHLPGVFLCARARVVSAVGMAGKGVVGMGMG